MPSEPKPAPGSRLCVVVHAQRAARALARHFDEAFRALGLTNGQFSLMMSLNRPEAPTVGQMADFLAMDRRKRRVQLTPAGHALLHKAYPIWQAAHAAIETRLVDPGELRANLQTLAAHEWEPGSS